jgi:tripartite-type tricarboxylate transporter receptor subunit TctC
MWKRYSAVPAAALMAAMLSGPALAWPDRQITITVVTGAGGSPDQVGRLLAAKLAERLGKPVVVENNTAGAGIAGTLAVARSQPDGHNIVILTGGTPSQQAMRPKQPYDLTRDFAHVTTLCAYPMVVAVPPNSPIKDFKDLIARAKANPGKLSYSMNAIGSLHHLLGEWINIEAGISMQGIPYRGSSQAFLDVTSGRVDLMVDTGTFAFGQIKQGQLRALAQSAPARYALAPDVPAVAETLPGISMMSWLGFAMAKDTPKPVIDRLNKEIREILELEDVKTKLAEMGNIPMASTPEEMHKRISTELAQWKKIIETKGIKPE